MKTVFIVCATKGRTLSCRANGWLWHSGFHSYLFARDSSVEGSSSSVQFWPRRNLWDEVKFCLDLMLSEQTLPATIHKFLSAFGCLKSQNLMNLTWSNFVIYFKGFYTRNKHSLLRFKYTNEKNEVQTTNPNDLSRTGAFMMWITFGIVPASLNILPVFVVYSNLTICPVHRSPLASNSATNTKRLKLRSFSLQTTLRARSLCPPWVQYFP